MKPEDENSDGGRVTALIIALITVTCLCVLLSLVFYLKLINPPHGRKATDSLMTEGKEASPIIYAALGDSTGVGVGARQGGYVIRLFKRMNEMRPGSKLTNACVSGATTEDVLRSQVEQALAARPNLITLGIGINDVGHGMSAETFARNYETIVKRLKTANAPIVITNIPDISLAPVVPPGSRAEAVRRIRLFNERIAEIASRYDLLVVDAFQSTRELIPSRPDFFSDDGFHPSDAGYESWAEAMWPTVKKAIEEYLLAMRPETDERTIQI